MGWSDRELQTAELQAISNNMRIVCQYQERQTQILETVLISERTMMLAGLLERFEGRKIQYLFKGDMFYRKGKITGSFSGFLIVVDYTKFPICGEELFINPCDIMELRLEEKL